MKHRALGRYYPPVEVLTVTWTDYDYDGPERRKDGQEAFERAVRAAAAEAAQQVSRVHRVRLVTQSFIAALVVSTAVALTFGLVFRHQAESLSQSEASANCHLVTGLSRDLGKFVQSDADVRRRQAQLNVAAKLVAQLRATGVNLSGLTVIARKSTEASEQTVKVWTDEVVPGLNQLARANCSTGLP